jgi:tetratricopeptide (TPR) repeat protein
MSEEEHGTDQGQGAREPSEVLSEEEAEARQREAGADGDEDAPRFNLEVVGENVSEAMTQLRDKVQYWVDRGRYNKVRVKRNGKPVLPDIPVGALMAFEAATFFWTGLLRGAIVNVVGRVFFEVELINEAEEHYKRGLEHFLAGDLEDAEECLERALRIDERYPRAHLQLGVLRKLQGRKEDARAHFENAIAYDTGGDTGREAEVHLKKLLEKK